MSILGSAGSKIISCTSRYGNLLPTAATNVFKLTTTSIGSSSAIYGNYCNSLNILTRSISTSPLLLAEPLKKQKRIDPQVVRKREERKQRKLEKAIKKLLKNAKQLKPVEELLVPPSVLDHPKERTRPKPKLTPAVEESRWLLEKEMCRVKFEKSTQEIMMIERLIKSQEKALSELKLESDTLYYAAIDMDPDLIPYNAVGPPDTPPMETYIPPEGDYLDITKKYEGEP